MAENKKQGTGNKIRSFIVQIRTVQKPHCYTYDGKDRLITKSTIL